MLKKKVLESPFEGLYRHVDGSNVVLLKEHIPLTNRFSVVCLTEDGSRVGISSGTSSPSSFLTLDNAKKLVPDLADLASKLPEFLPLIQTASFS